MGKIGLVLSGGGARGAYQIGVLAAIGEQMTRQRANESPPSPFQVITGVSVGAINAAYLASRADDFPDAAKSLRKLWLSLHCNDIYHTSLPRLAQRLGHWISSLGLGCLGVSPPDALLNNAPLRALLEREVDFDRLHALLETETLDAFAITATSYDCSQCVSFYAGHEQISPWHRSRRLGVPTHFTPAHILASSALPIVFPSIELGGIHFGDGALRQTAPLSPAIHLGTDKIFVVGARDANVPTGMTPPLKPTYPSVGYLAGQVLDIVFNDNLEEDVDRLHRVNQTLDIMMPKRRAETDLRALDVLMIQPSEDIRDITARHVDSLPRGMRLLLRAIGGWKAPWVLPSYLMFEPGYVGDLIALGHKDATARMDEIQTFLEL